MDLKIAIQQVSTRRSVLSPEAVAGAEAAGRAAFARGEPMPRVPFAFLDRSPRAAWTVARQRGWKWAQAEAAEMRSARQTRGMDRLIAYRIARGVDPEE